jgi:hypothetical protein
MATKEKSDNNNLQKKTKPQDNQTNITVLRRKDI